MAGAFSEELLELDEDLSEPALPELPELLVPDSLVLDSLAEPESPLESPPESPLEPASFSDRCREFRGP